MGSGLAHADGPHEREHKEEEGGPEEDDLDKKPYGAILLNILALFTVRTEVGHVGNGINHKTEESVGDQYVPRDSPVHADKDYGEKDSCSDPLNNVPDSEQEEGRIEDFASFFGVSQGSRKSAGLQSVD